MVKESNYNIHGLTKHEKQGSWADVINLLVIALTWLIFVGVMWPQQLIGQNTFESWMKTLLFRRAWLLYYQRNLKGSKPIIIASYCALGFFFFSLINRRLNTVIGTVYKSLTSLNFKISTNTLTGLIILP